MNMRVVEAWLYLLLWRLYFAHRAEGEFEGFLFFSCFVYAGIMDREYTTDIGLKA
jgi:hypothetical protein